MKNKNLEIACFNLESAIIAQQYGADRVELCDNMFEGGTSPKVEIARKVRDELNIKMNVMIRPRGGNFVYNDAEFEHMKLEIQQFKKINVDGFVFGILNEDNSFDFKRNKELVKLASPIPCTFHRAFDIVSNVYKSLELVIDCGFKTVLTSGQGENVMDGIEVLTTLVEKAKGRIVVMPGGGLRSSNIVMLDQEINATFYHSSAIIDSSEIANGNEVERIKNAL
ncbi:copper homeostasis protein CutC [Flavobacterium sp. 5]|uniref:copper homeostasis protein CutC n=1 Tax=Flavobacterium sp. 5 TaxID=2035199 RepID=UPI000C2BFE8E|nr:copper homeostasis protein CutC [Flavobacterium sp. 5]PKB16128.1 copper homeostasis protein [Flavobacterium sp. 5]